MKKLILTTLALFSVVGAAFADDEITFDVAAPTAVEAGELFRIEFVVNARKDVEFTPPTIEGLEVMAGPSSAVSTNIQMVNGDFTRTETTTYTYVLQGFTAGLHTISAAQVTVGGKSYSTRPVTIEVVGDAGQGGGGEQGQDGQQGQGSAAGTASPPEVSADDIFIRAVASRNEVYKGEPVVVTLKLYSRVQYFGLDALDKVPSFNGLWQQDISPADANSTQQRQTVNNRVYNTWTLKEYLLYPQQSGRLTIDPFEASISVQYQVQSTPRNIFDAMMGGTATQSVRKKIASPPVNLDVREWPGGAPEGFDGAVGEFQLSATPPASAMNANTSGTYTLRLSGTGNFPLIRAPKLSFPDSFEQYNVTTSDNTRHTRGGTSGYREFSYPFIPRSDGFYTIPALEFSYFDPRQGRYVTLSSNEASIEVAVDSTAVHSPGVGAGGGLVSGISREDLKVFGQDIRFIKRGGANLRPKGRAGLFMWSPLYLSLIALILVLFAVGFVVLRRYVRNMQSDRFVRSKRANKVALRRFRAAEASMKHGDKHGFYDEMLKALWGYMSDRLDIPMSNLSKDRIREELFERSVDETQTGEYIRIISECEEAQYSPASSARMNEIYREGVSLVSELESAIKRK